MSDLYPYRANEELTTAWRAHINDRGQHIDTVVRPFTDAYPNNEPMVHHRGDVIGFRDGDPDAPPPTGLSRAKTREWLVPVRGKAGDEWRGWMSKLSLPVTDRQVLRRFGFEDQLFSRRSGTYLGFPNVVDFEEDGVWVYTGYEISKLPDCVTPAKLSEFYAAQERAQARQEAGAS